MLRREAQMLALPYVCFGHGLDAGPVRKVPVVGLVGKRLVSMECYVIDVHVVAMVKLLQPYVHLGEAMSMPAQPPATAGATKPGCGRS